MAAAPAGSLLLRRLKLRNARGRRWRASGINEMREGSCSGQRYRRAPGIYFRQEAHGAIRVIERSCRRTHSRFPQERRYRLTRPRQCRRSRCRKDLASLALLKFI
jgi:hypothetical protein